MFKVRLKAAFLIIVFWLITKTSFASTYKRLKLFPTPPHKLMIPSQLPPQYVPKRFRGQIITRRPQHFKEKIVALTFDDGPDPFVTPIILDSLRRFKAKATFFIIGERGKEWPQLLQREAREGHAVESHSFSHPHEEINTWHAWRELQRSALVIATWTGRPPTLFRPPYGHLHNNLTKMALQLNMCVVRWTICSYDGNRQTAEDVVEAATRHVHPGDIILLHDGRDRLATAKALPEILRRLAAQGFRFVTMPQLLRRWEAWANKQRRK